MIKRLIIVLSIIATMFVIPTPSYASDVLPNPTVIGHNGGMGIAPENTVIGIVRTAEAGASEIDVDVRWSANANTQTNPGYPVLMHDDTVDRTTNGMGNVSSLGLTALTQLLAQDYAPWKTDPLYATTTVPYAWDFFNASRNTGITLQLDIKGVPGEWNARKLMEYADRFPGGRDRLIYMGSAPSITAMKQWFPDLRFVLIEYPPTGTMRTGEFLTQLGAYKYSVPQQYITKPFVDYYHSYGIEVGTWTTDTDGIYDNSTIWEKVTVAGVDSITTNKVTDLLEWETEN